MEELNEKLNKYFAGKVVRKDLTKKIKDDYIKNFLCPQDDEEYEEALINY